MTTTYESIESKTLVSTATDITFTDISGTYTDLVLISDILMSGAQANCFVQVGNGTIDTGSNYSYTILSGNGSTASSDRGSNDTRGIFFTNNSYPQTTTRNLTIMSFQNYSNTTTNKTILFRSNNAALGTDAIVGLWRSTSAINRIKVYPTNNSFASGSTFSLYGIKAE
jgi:hypothetical protein